MPIREYIVSGDRGGCDYCKAGFELLERISDPVLTVCPKCGAPVSREFSVPRVNIAAGHLDDRAKAKGFHKLKKIGHGEYEKQY